MASCKKTVAMVTLGTEFIFLMIVFTDSVFKKKLSTQLLRILPKGVFLFSSVKTFKK